MQQYIDFKNNFSSIPHKSVEDLKINNIEVDGEFVYRVCWKCCGSFHSFSTEQMYYANRVYDLLESKLKV